MRIGKVSVPLRAGSVSSVFQALLRPPRDMLRHLMEHRGLRQRDLVPIFGSSSVVSDVIQGKRAVSKAQARRLGEFFRVSAEVFI